VIALDQLIAQLGAGGATPVVLAVALLLGLRHASDPDHLVAVSTLVASEPGEGVRRAGRLGLWWGLGHATTLTLLGLPIIFFNRYLPKQIEEGAEILIGLVIVALALRLLARWRRGEFHAHAHSHGGFVHRHLHSHSETATHAHEHVRVRTPVQAYGVGLVHGIGGSAGVGLLLLASIESIPAAIAALLIFVSGAALSMAAMSSGLGWALARPKVRLSTRRLVPVLGLLSLTFGVVYAVAAFATAV
jgi:high-affinity nickel permease